MRTGMLEQSKPYTERSGQLGADRSGQLGMDSVVAPKQMPPLPGLVSAVDDACERINRLIDLHDGLLTRLRGSRPEEPNGTAFPAGDGVVAAVNRLHAMFSRLEAQTEELANIIG